MNDYALCAVCGLAGHRGGPMHATRMTEDPEQVTCLQCLDVLTRPSKD